MHINHTFQITQQDFEKLKHNENVLLKCEVCSEQYYRTKHSITSKYKLKGVFPRFCSRTCHSNSMKREDVNCQHCMQSFKPKKSTTKKFCSLSCAASTQGKVNWDSIDLIDLIENQKIPKTKIADMMHCSDQAVNKRYKKLKAL